MYLGKIMGDSMSLRCKGFGNVNIDSSYVNTLKAEVDDGNIRISNAHRDVTCTVHEKGRIDIGQRFLGLPCVVISTSVLYSLLDSLDGSLEVSGQRALVNVALLRHDHVNIELDTGASKLC